MKKYVILCFAALLCSIDATSASLSTAAIEELFKGCETDEQKVERVIAKASEGDYQTVADAIPQLIGQMKRVSGRLKEIKNFDFVQLIDCVLSRIRNLKMQDRTLAGSGGLDRMVSTRYKLIINRLCQDFLNHKNVDSLWETIVPYDVVCSDFTEGIYNTIVSKRLVLSLNKLIPLYVSSSFRLDGIRTYILDHITSGNAQGIMQYLIAHNCSGDKITAVFARICELKIPLNWENMKGLRESPKELLTWVYSKVTQENAELCAEVVIRSYNKLEAKNFLERIKEKGITISEGLNKELTKLANSRKKTSAEITEEGRKYYHDFSSKNNAKGILNDPEHSRQTSRRVRFTKKTEADDNDSTHAEGGEADLEDRNDTINSLPGMEEMYLDDIAGI